MRKLICILLGCFLLAGVAFAQSSSDELLEKLQGTWVSENTQTTYVISGKKLTMSPSTLPFDYTITKVTKDEIQIKAKINGVSTKYRWSYSFDGDDLYINGAGPYKKR